MLNLNLNSGTCEHQLLESNKTNHAVFKKMYFVHEMLWKILKTSLTFSKSKTPVHKENFIIL